MPAASMTRGGEAARRGAAAALFSVLLATAGLSRAEDNPVVFQSTDTPPYWSASLPENGLGGAMLHLVSAAAGVQYSIEYVPVKRFRHSLAPYIVGDPDLLISPKRLAIFPIGVFHSAFFYYKPHHDAIDFHGLRSLQGYTLGALRGTLDDQDYFVRNGLKVEESDSVVSLLKKLQKGRIDFCILILGAGRYAIQENFPEDRDKFVQAIIPGSARPIAIMIDIAVPEGKAVAQRYRQALGKTLRSREYRDILEEYYGKNKIPGDSFEELHRFERQYANTWGD